MSFYLNYKEKKCGKNVCWNNSTSGGNININMINNNNNNLYSLEESSIRNFYEYGSIFITGGTGFIGKALTEKLLRTCTTISAIYLLIRPKKGQTVDERCQHLLENPVFDRIRYEMKAGAELLSKIKCIEGDVTATELGISEENQSILLNEVTAVFHSAATVKFNESLDTAVTLNTLGTQRVLMFCRQMKRIKALIHVSTAYSNSDKEEILETVYPLPEDIIGSIKSQKILSKQLLTDIGLKLLPTHPNTYTVTKAMAEWVVAEHADEIPLAIVRPSIVTASWKEPFPGWVDNVSGITGIMMEIGRGTIRSIICDQRLVVDIIPVDLVVNSLLAAAWHTSTFRSNATRVYNCTSGTLNALSWEELGALTQHHALESPSRYIQWYPGFTFRTNRFIHSLCEMMFHFFPAFIFDAALRIVGSKPMMLKIYNRFKMAAKTGEFFALHQWNFINENLLILQREMNTPLDREIFNVDITSLNWDSYIKNYMLGIRKYILKDPVETVSSAKTKLHRLYWAHRTMQIITVIVILKILRK